jgi:uncharacterized protein YydD (DUF2326 family)
MFSDLSSFKEIKFNPGLNILIAEKTPDASDQQTRNRAGKTSLIEIIHFLMGSGADKEHSIFRTGALENFSFMMDFDLGNSHTVIGRRGINPSKINIIKANTEKWPYPPHFDRQSHETSISNTKWISILGSILFKLPDFDPNDLVQKFSPTFRSLFSYYVRRVNVGAFENPVQQHQHQNLWDQQIAISYLLGLDWTIAQKWQLIRVREKTLRELKKAIGEGALGEIIGTVSHLRTELTIAGERIRIFRRQLENFQVLPEYHELEIEASEISNKLAEYVNDDVIDLELIEELNRFLSDERPPSFEDLENIYQEAGITFPEIVSRRMSELKEFHESIIANRKSYLSHEIEEANRRIASREGIKQQISDRRAKIWEILNSHGALDHFAQLNSELIRQEINFETLKQKFYTAEQLEGQKTELDIERQNLLIRLRRNYQEQDDVIRHIILTFEEISSRLYEEAGRLEIKGSLNGPQVEVRIQGEKSKGIKNMQIFCFDLMLMQLSCEKGIGPGFLVHDSHIFDPVDERQIAAALNIGAQKAKSFGFQYIVTMNSDNMPETYPSGFNLDDYIIPVRLTDATENGGLFGFRF